MLLPQSFIWYSEIPSHHPSKWRSTPSHHLSKWRCTMPTSRPLCTRLFIHSFHVLRPSQHPLWSQLPCHPSPSTRLFIPLLCYPSIHTALKHVAAYLLLFCHKVSNPTTLLYTWLLRQFFVPTYIANCTHGKYFLLSSHIRAPSFIPHICSLHHIHRNSFFRRHDRCIRDSRLLPQTNTNRYICKLILSIIVHIFIGATSPDDEQH